MLSPYPESLNFEWNADDPLLVNFCRRNDAHSHITHRQTLLRAERLSSDTIQVS